MVEPSPSDPVEAAVSAEEKPRGESLDWGQRRSRSAPRQAATDLTDAGSRHPGYLVESIMNPNAMIVDGPGYTDDRGGGSTMPDNRDNLTVGELIDLVAYSRALQAKPDPVGAGS